MMDSWKVRSLPELEAGYMTYGDLMDEIKEEGIEEGRKEGREEVIGLLVEVLQETGFTKEAAAAKLKEKYPDYADMAKELVDKYWKQG